ncbi:endonuclease/exonuclease/phosphatase family protein [Jiangella anatolica]|uniref:Endonuclease/exonuclease/phosphatase domain-containing protein n=1 Tax=Jiangella anatolica TaxID=2670374 RepID=A0A2W2BJ03_9ACTN|nr:endonuclease/exonuclease/phosphatase family protein [Jiangella anatolica]PZF80314.1 hypothetical protein C1I92_26880 [Jiangella anatolica]
MADSPSPRIRVATLNVWGRHGDWTARRAVLRDGFARLAPDLVALQETVVTDDYDQAADLFGPEYTVVHHGTRTAEGVGCTIVSRWQPGRVDQTDLWVTDRVDPSDFVGQCAAVEVATPLGPLLFANHKPSWRVELEHERELQAVRGAAFVDHVAGGRRLPVVVAGDMDARPESASMRFWTGRQSLGGAGVAYQDAWEFSHPGDPGLTFTPANPLVGPDWRGISGRRIDYVLLRCLDRSPPLTVDSCRRLFDEPVDGTWASDHFGVVCDLTTPASRMTVG